jgi:hypothetical protein
MISCIAIAYQISVILYLIHILKDIPALVNLAPEGDLIEGFDKSPELKYPSKDYKFSGHERLPKIDSKTLIIDEMHLEIWHAFSNKRSYYRLIFLILMPFVATGQTGTDGQK